MVVHLEEGGLEEVMVGECLITEQEEDIGGLEEDGEDSTGVEEDMVIFWFYLAKGRYTTYSK